MLRLLKQYFPIRNAVFFMMESIVIFLTFLITSIILTFSPSYFFDAMLLLRIVIITMICVVCLYYSDLYDFDIVNTLPEMSVRLIQALGISSLILSFIYIFFPLTIIDKTAFISSILLLIFFIISWRFFYLSILDKGFFNQQIIILGSSALSVDIYNKIKGAIDCGYHVKAIFPDVNDKNTKAFGEKVNFYFDIHHLHKTATSGKIKKIVVSLKEQRGTFPMDQLLKCRNSGIEIIEGSTFYEQLTGKVLVEKIKPSWLIFSDGFKKSMRRRFLKRFLDILGSLILIMVFSPIMIIFSILIKLESSGPIIFKQDRVGKNKKEFHMHKFRSMVNNAEQLTGPVWAGEDDPRITKIGKFIRKYRIDELPQLFDVLKGSMSIVGPRPERMHFIKELEKEIPFYSQRFLVKPGITGWAQVCADYAATVEDTIEKLNYDLFYIKNMTTTMDIIIILRTIKIVLFGRGSR